MAITVADLKFFQSERMTDEIDGGGQMTATEIISGQSNQIFDDISDVDRAVGDVSIRKAYAAVTSANTDKYLDAGVLVFREPADTNTSVLMTSTRDYYDERDAIKDYIESYMIRGARFAGFLYETQMAGTRALTIFGRSESDPPKINETLLLTEYTTTNYTNENYSQYVRIVRILLNELQSFTDDSGTYTRRVITVELSEQLRYTFHGAEMSRRDNLKPLAVIYSTMVADGINYYGVQPFAAQATSGAYSVTVDSIYGALVPTSQVETPLLDMTAGALRTFACPAADGTVSFVVGDTFSPNFTLYAGQAVYPGTLSITVSGGTLTDNGGQLMDGVITIGTVNYNTGEIVFGESSPSFYGSKTVTFRPAVALTRISNSHAIPITAQTRFRTYVTTLAPLPNPGTLEVCYLSQGNWYRLYDQGNGTLQGASTSYGSGTVNYLSGSVSLTLGAYPDVFSSILCFYALGADTIPCARNDVVLTLELNVGTPRIVAGSSALSWDGNTLTDQGDGTLTGTGGSATLDYATGLLRLTPTTIPSSGTQLSFSCNYIVPGDWYTVAATITDNTNGILTLSIPTNAVGSSIMLSNVFLRALDSNFTGEDWPEEVLSVFTRPYRFRSVMAAESGTAWASGWTGTINVGGGTMTLDTNKTFAADYNKPTWDRIDTGYWSYDGENGIWVWIVLNDHLIITGYETVNESLDWRFDTGYNITLDYRTVSTPQAYTATLTLNALVFSVKSSSAEPVVTNSLRISFGSRIYQDLNGVVVYNRSPTTGQGTPAGTFSSTTGMITLTSWPSGDNSIDILAQLGQVSIFPTRKVCFLTPSAPIAPTSFTVTATTLSNTTVTGISNENGVVVSSDLYGRIDYQNGMVEIAFNNYIDLQSLTYNCVSYSNVPVDSSIIGIDATRMPSDGRISIFRPGQLVLAHNTQTHSENSLSPTQQVDMGRTRLYRVVIADHDGLRLPASFYSVDRVTGIVTMAADLNLTGYTGPYAFQHTIADLSMVMDADLSGAIRISKAVSHTYPADTSYLSGVLYIGTLQARYTNLFAQSTWTSVWSDTRIGDEPLAQYNDTSYPIVVSNLGAYKDRFLIRFTSSSAFQCYGEKLGLIGTGNINSDFAPSNLLTGQPYFTIDSRGWGGGWSTGNCLRFNLISSCFPVDLIRAIQPSPATDTDDSVELLFIGNVDA